MIYVDWNVHAKIAVGAAHNAYDKARREGKNHDQAKAIAVAELSRQNDIFTGPKGYGPGSDEYWAIVAEGEEAIGK
jgi:hypothetical protein